MSYLKKKIQGSAPPALGAKSFRPLSPEQRAWPQGADEALYPRMDPRRHEETEPGGRAEQGSHSLMNSSPSSLTDWLWELLSEEHIFLFSQPLEKVQQ